jgi:hypothetical protein
LEFFRSLFRPCEKLNPALDFGWWRTASAMKAGATEGMQHFDGEIAQLVRDRVADLETGLCFDSNPAVLGQELVR